MNAARATDALTSALALASGGLPCFPCGANKRPMTSRGFKDAARDCELIHLLWRDHWGPLIGVPTGEVSGIDVLDIDQNGGASWFAERRGDLPPTRVHRTRSGGLHLFFQHEHGLRCSAGRLAAGVDVRADGGYVIWWPAAGFSVLRDGPLAKWPRPLLSSPKTKSAPARRTVVFDEVSLARLVRTVVGARSGERNNVTYWAACRAGEMVSSGLLDAGLAAEVITDAATRAGLSLPEARRAARSGIRTTGGGRHA